MRGTQRWAVGPEVTSQCGEVERQGAFGLEGPAGYKLSSTDWAFDGHRGR